MNVLFLMLVDRMLPFLLSQKAFSMGVWDVIIIFTAVRECSVYSPLVRCVFHQLTDSLRSDLGFLPDI